MKTKFVILLLLIAVTASAQTKKTLAPYLAMVEFSDTEDKQSAVNLGMYGYYGWDTHSLEADLGLTTFSYTRQDTIFTRGGRYSTQPITFTQQDLTLVYSNYSLKNWKFRTGLHYLSTPDADSDGSLALIGGIGYFRPYYYNIDLDGYYLMMPNQTVMQLSPRVGYLFGDYFSYGSFQIRLGADLIRHEDATVFEDSDFYSGIGELYYYKGKLTASFKVDYGLQYLGLKNNGFLLMYAEERFTASYVAGIEYGISKRSTLMSSVTYRSFNEADNPQQTSTSLGFLLGLYYTF